VFLYATDADVEKLEKYIDDKQFFKNEDVLLEYIRKISARDPLRAVAVWIKYRSYAEDMSAVTLDRILVRLSKTLFVFVRDRLHIAPR
jgi:hypothetical protein